MSVEEPVRLHSLASRLRATAGGLSETTQVDSPVEHPPSLRSSDVAAARWDKAGAVVLPSTPGLHIAFLSPALTWPLSLQLDSYGN